MTNVLLLSRFERLGSSSRLRSYQYLPYLEAAGFEVTAAPLLGDDYLRNLYAGRSRLSVGVVLAHVCRVAWLLKARRYDLLWIEGELFPWLPPWWELFLGRLGIPYVVDYDDAMFHRYDLHGSPLVRLLLRNKVDRIMRRSALVIAGNGYIAERARGAGARRVELLPTVIDLDRYRLTPVPRDGVFTVGWIGSPSTAKYLHWLQPALAEVCRGGEARLAAIGSGPLALDGVPTEVRPWVEDSEVAGIQRFQAGIMPLPDEPIERGKCGYKLIQYMACGLPVVASPVGINKQIVEHGVDGFLAANHEEWVHYLTILKKDDALREKMGREGRKKVELEYCLRVTAPRLASYLKSVGESSP